MLPIWNLTSTFPRDDDRQLSTATLTTTWLPMCPESTDVHTKQDAKTEGQHALLYIVVVILFYASAMILLVIKYLRRKKDNSAIIYYESHFRRSNISSIYSTISVYHDV